MPTYDFHAIDPDVGPFELRQIAIGLNPGLTLIEITLNDAQDDYNVAVTTDGELSALQALFEEAAQTLKANGYYLPDDEGDN